MEESSKQPTSITMISYIILNDKKEPSQDWEIIPKKKYTIGRSKKDVDITMKDNLLSRKHAELVYYDSKTIVVKDLDSRNGTYINKERIEPEKERCFTSKDLLSFGSTNNEIVFFDKNEQGKEIVESDYEKNKENEKKEKEEKEKKNEKDESKSNLEETNGNDNYKKKEKIEEEINTDLKKKSYDREEKNIQKKEWKMIWIEMMIGKEKEKEKVIKEEKDMKIIIINIKKSLAQALQEIGEEI